MPLVFDKSVPDWTRRACRREYRRQQLVDWTVKIVTTDKEMQGNDGVTVMLTTYLSATIYLNASLKNDGGGQETVFHEFRHLGLAQVQRIIADHFPKKAKAREAILHEIDTWIEGFISRDWQIWGKK